MGAQQPNLLPQLCLCNAFSIMPAQAVILPMHMIKKTIISHLVLACVSILCASRITFCADVRESVLLCACSGESCPDHYGPTPNAFECTIYKMCLGIERVRVND